MKKVEMNRRNFLKASAITGAGLIGGNLLGGKSPVAYGASNNVNLPKAKIPVVAEADVVVVGGGPGGFAAALRAARGGADTILIERYDQPGGVHTSGLQGAAGAGVGGIHTELMNRFANEGYIYTATQNDYPDFNGNPLSHYGASATLGSPFSRSTFNPDGAGCVLVKMLEEAGVRSMYNTLFLDTIVQDNIYGDDTIEAVIVQNASGKQAIRGKIFVDGSGTSEVVARSGAPFIRGGGGSEGWPIPGGQLWTMSGVDYLKLHDYQKSTNDWALSNLIAAALAAGDIPADLYRPRLPGANIYGSLYIGHPTIDMNPTGGPGGWIFWENIPYEWALHMDDSAEDMNRGRAAMRDFIDAESKFMKKYVPGFEKAFITNIGRLMGVRDGRHTVGEYVFTLDDGINSRTFPDNTITRTSNFNYVSKTYTYQVPYRCFLAKKINNLLLTGASMSFTYEVIFHVMRNFPWVTQSGEIAGFAAAWAIDEGVSPKALNWTQPYQANPPLV